MSKLWLYYVSQTACNIQFIDSDGINKTSSLLNNNTLPILRYWYILLTISLLLILRLSIALVIVSHVTGDGLVSFQFAMTPMSLLILSFWLCFKSFKTVQWTCNDSPISYHLSLMWYNRWTSSSSWGVSFNILVMSEIQQQNNYYNKL